MVAHLHIGIVHSHYVHAGNALNGFGLYHQGLGPHFHRADAGLLQGGLHLLHRLRRLGLLLLTHQLFLQGFHRFHLPVPPSEW